MTIQKAITKAEKAGWVAVGVYKATGFNEWGRAFLLTCVFTDPGFWQALGIALGWENEETCPTCGYLSAENWGKRWKAEMHRFIDHLADGKDAKSFFETL
jgi:hypothetical protein